LIKSPFDRYFQFIKSKKHKLNGLEEHELNGSEEHELNGLEEHELNGLEKYRFIEQLISKFEER